LNIFETCKKPLLEQNFSLIKVNLGDFSWLKFCPNHWAFFSRKNFAIKNHPKGKILPNLVTLNSNINNNATEVNFQQKLWFQQKICIFEQYRKIQTRKYL
jgi:hypothetical protein